MNQLIALFTFVAMSNLVLSNFLSSSNPSEEKQKNSSLFVLHSSLNLSQVFHQDFDLTAITELDDTLLANLAYTLTGEVELASDFLQTLLVATDTIAVAQNLALTVLQYRVADTRWSSLAIDSKSTPLSVRLSSPEAITSTIALSSSSLPNGASILMWWLSALMVWSILLSSILVICSQLSNRRLALVLLLELADFCADLAQCTYLVQRQANDTALLSDSLQDALTNPPYCV